MTFEYYQLTRPEVLRAAKQQALKASVQAFLAKNAMEVQYWDPGQNEGVVKSGLIILELNKDLFPESYARIRADIDADIVFAQQHRDQQAHRAAMDAAAKNILTILRSLAGGA